MTNLGELMLNHMETIVVVGACMIALLLGICLWMAVRMRRQGAELQRLSPSPANGSRQNKGWVIGTGRELPNLTTYPTVKVLPPPDCDDCVYKETRFYETPVLRRLIEPCQRHRESAQVQ